MKYLKSTNDFVQLIRKTMNVGYRDMTIWFKNQHKHISLNYNDNLPQEYDVPFDKFDDIIAVQVTIDHTDEVLNFVLQNDFDTTFKRENDIFRKGMIQKFGSGYLNELISYMINEKNAHIEKINNETESKILEYKHLNERVNF